MQFPKAGIGNMVILASVMEGEGAGIKDEYLTLYLGSEDGEKDDFGREVGSYLMATKGKHVRIFQESLLIECGQMSQYHVYGLPSISLLTVFKRLTDSSF